MFDKPFPADIILWRQCLCRRSLEQTDALLQMIQGHVLPGITKTLVVDIWSRGMHLISLLPIPLSLFLSLSLSLSPLPGNNVPSVLETGIRAQYPSR